MITRPSILGFALLLLAVLVVGGCSIQDRFPGLERITIHAGALAIPPSAMRRDLEWFGREVLPRFTQVK